jgi:hypothetical protein
VLVPWDKFSLCHTPIRLISAFQDKISILIVGCVTTWSRSSHQLVSEPHLGHITRLNRITKTRIQNYLTEKTNFHLKIPNKHPTNLDKSISNLKTTFNQSKNQNLSWIRKHFQAQIYFFHQYKGSKTPKRKKGWFFYFSIKFDP